MIGTIDLLKADHVGIRELKNKSSLYMRQKRSVIVTDRGKPRKVLVSYDEMVSLLETLADLMDPKIRVSLSKGRAAVESGAKGVPARAFFETRAKA